jgi:protein-L-isoaspartate(D-aspartate) O-methyltransferase
MTFDFSAARQLMVDSQIRPSDVTDLAIQSAFRAVPREQFCPAGKAFQAYADAEVEYAPGRWMLRPRELAKLLQALQPRAGEHALAIAAPYGAALLRAIGLDVVECVPEASVADLKHPPKGPFDLVLCEGAVSSVPDAWLAALADGGRLGVVVRNGPVGKAVVYTRSGALIGSREAFDSTPPVLAGFEAETRFAF